MRPFALMTTPRSLALAGTIALAASLSTASAEVLPKDLLPPTGKTIAGPGVAQPSAAGNMVWQSTRGVDICATVVSSTGTGGSIHLTLQPYGLTMSRGPQGAFSLCGFGQNRVYINTTRQQQIIWRVDQF